MKRQIVNSLLMTAALTVLLGIIYPIAITGISQLVFHDRANGQLIEMNGELIGSSLIGQPFTGPGYFHSRPSATNYDAANSGGSNLGPTNAALLTRINDAARNMSTDQAVPVDLVTTSGSGLDPDITPAAAYFQAARVARERQLPEPRVITLIRAHTRGRQFGILGEPRVNVLELNLALDEQVGH